MKTLFVSCLSPSPVFGHDLVARTTLKFCITCNGENAWNQVESVGNDSWRVGGIILYLSCGNIQCDILQIRNAKSRVDCKQSKAGYGSAVRASLKPVVSYYCSRY